MLIAPESCLSKTLEIQKEVFLQNFVISEYIYLLLAECEVRTASYGPGLFLPFMAQVRGP